MWRSRRIRMLGVSRVESGWGDWDRGWVEVFVDEDREDELGFLVGD